MKVLIESGADIQLKVNNASILCENSALNCYNLDIGQGHTALHLASANGHLEVVKILIASGANVNVKNDVSTA